MNCEHTSPVSRTPRGNARRRWRRPILAPVSVLTVVLLGAAWVLGGSGVGCGSASPPNIVLVILDTVRADAVGTSPEQARIAPHFAALCDEGTLFTGARAAGPWTIPSHGSIFTGLYPHEHRAIHENFLLNEELTTLAEILAEAGYVTGAVSANPWINAGNGWGQGFQYFEEAYRLAKEPDKGGDMVTAFVKRWLSEVDKGDRPFFLFVNYLDAHLPYAPPDSVLDRLGGSDLTKDERIFTLLQHGRYITGEDTLSEGDLERVRLLYRAGVAYVDDQVGRVVDFLREEGTLDDTILILTSDHGEHLGEHQLLGHEFSVYEELLRVPLLIRYPELFPAGEEVAAPVSLIDLVPTAREIARRPTDRSTDPGISLLETLRSGGDPNRVLLSEYARPTSLLHHAWKPAHPTMNLSRFDVSLDAVRRGSYKYIRSSRGAEEMYDLGPDPGEQVNLASSGDRADTLIALRSTLRQARWGFGPP